MNLREIINEVLKDIDDSLSDSDIIGWVNRALDDLTPVAQYQQMKTLELKPETKYIEIPADMHEIVLLTDGIGDLSELSLSDKTGSGYKMWGSNLILQPVFTMDKEIILYYYAKLPHLTVDNEIPVIREDFHDLLVLYATAKAKYKDEVMEMHQSTMQEYLERKRQFAMETSSSDNNLYQVKLL